MIQNNRMNQENIKLTIGICKPLNFISFTNNDSDQYVYLQQKVCYLLSDSILNISWCLVGT